jgi:hypothetical protein
MKLCIMALSRMAFSILTLNFMALSKNALSKNALGIKALSIKTISIIKLCIKVLNVMALRTITLSKMALSISIKNATFSITTRVVKLIAPFFLCQSVVMLNVVALGKSLFVVYVFNLFCYCLRKPMCLATIFQIVI